MQRGSDDEVPAAAGRGPARARAQGRGRGAGDRSAGPLVSRRESSGRSESPLSTVAAEGVQRGPTGQSVVKGGPGVAAEAATTVAERV